MRWDESTLRQWRERRAMMDNPVTTARSDDGMDEGSRTGIPSAPAAGKRPVRKKPFRLTTYEPEEDAVLDAIRKLLRIHRRVAWHTRINSGAMKVKSAKGRDRYVRFHDCPGMSDLLGQLVDGRLLAIEVKRPSWRKPTDERELAQQEFIRLVCEAGGLGMVARSVDEVLLYLGSPT